MNLILRYFGLCLLSLALPVFTLLPFDVLEETGVDLITRAMFVPIYGCLAVFLMTSFNPAKMRQHLEATRTRIDDLHLWLAPVLVMLAFLWAGFILIGMLAMADVHEAYPIAFLALTMGATGLAAWIAIRVRRAFFRGS